VVQTLSSTVVDLNQKTYQRLKAALELNLRRQIFVAVCDNLILRDRLAAELESDLSGQRAHHRASSRNRSYPQLVTLKLDLSNPDPLNQIASWLRDFPPPVNRRNQALIPAFQLLGIEQLSRQSASVQWLFLNHLRSIEHSLPVLESSMVVWVTRPWSRMIPQSAPDFWRCRTAVFDFIGEPTPLVSLPETFPQASTPIRATRVPAPPKNRSQTPTSGDRPLNVLRFKPNERSKTPNSETVIPSARSTPIDSTQSSASKQSRDLSITAASPVTPTPSKGQDSSNNKPATRLSAKPQPNVEAPLTETPLSDHSASSKDANVQDAKAPKLNASKRITDSTQRKAASKPSSGSTTRHDSDQTGLNEGRVAHSLSSQSPRIEQQEPAGLEEQEPDIQETLSELMNGTLMNELGGTSTDSPISETLDIDSISALGTLSYETEQERVSQAQSQPPSSDDSASNTAQNIAAESEQHSDEPPPENRQADDVVIEVDQPPQENAEHLGFGQTFTDPWSTQQFVPDEEEDPSDLTSDGDTTLDLSILDSDGSENVTDVLPLEAGTDTHIAEDVSDMDSVVDATPTESTFNLLYPHDADTDAHVVEDVSDADSVVDATPTESTFNLLYPDAADTESLELVDADSELEVFDAEPNFLNASLSSDPGLGFSTVGQTPAQRSWLDSSISEAEQADLAAEDPQAFALVEQIERLRQQRAPQTVLAGAYRGLGNLYRDRIEQGDISPKNLVRAMKAYESVLQIVNDNSPTWSEVLNDMGNLCWLLSRCAPTPEQGLPHLQQGIQAYRMALTKINPKTHPQTYPMIQNNLGAAYGDLARYHNPFDNLQQSVQAYQEALRYRKAEADPMRFASTQNNLGTTYWNLAQYREPVQNLKRATDAYSKALVYYQPDTDPLNYAMIQNNLGTAFWNLAQHERSDKWLGAAIDAYTIALKYRTLETNPVAYAATQNNLGTAYWHISEYHEKSPETRMDFLRQAVHSYREALNAAELIQQSKQPMALNFDVFATRNNFGLVQYQLATDGKFQVKDERDEQLLENALDQHLSALQGWQGRPELRQTAIQCVIQTLKAIYSQKGLIGQNLALSKIPGQLLPEILPQL